MLRLQVPSNLALGYFSHRFQTKVLREAALQDQGYSFQFHCSTVQKGLDCLTQHNLRSGPRIRPDGSLLEGNHSGAVAHAAAVVVVADPVQSSDGPEEGRSPELDLLAHNSSGEAAAGDAALEVEDLDLDHIPAVALDPDRTRRRNHCTPGHSHDPGGAVAARPIGHYLHSHCCTDHNLPDRSSPSLGLAGRRTEHIVREVPASHGRSRIGRALRSCYTDRRPSWAVILDWNGSDGVNTLSSSVRCPIVESPSTRDYDVGNL